MGLEDRCIQSCFIIKVHFTAYIKLAIDIDCSGHGIFSWKYRSYKSSVLLARGTGRTRQVLILVEQRQLHRF